MPDPNSARGPRPRRRLEWAWAAAALVLSTAGAFGIARLFRRGPESFRVAPSSLSFGRFAQGAANPEPQLVYISGISGKVADFTAWTNDPWLHVNPQKATSPAMIRISVDASRLPAGRYSGYITIAGPHQSSRVPVRLAVGAPAPKVADENIGVSPPELSFGPFRQGATHSAPQWLNITGYGADFTVSASDPWLHTSPQRISLQGKSPARVRVSVKASRLTAGKYSGYVFITGPRQSSRVQVHVAVNAPHASGQADRRSPPAQVTRTPVQPAISVVPPATFIQPPAPPGGARLRAPPRSDFAGIGGITWRYYLDESWRSYGSRDGLQWPGVPRQNNQRQTAGRRSGHNITRSWLHRHPTALRSGPLVPLYVSIHRNKRKRHIDMESEAELRSPGPMPARDLPSRIQQL